MKRHWLFQDVDWELLRSDGPLVDLRTVLQRKVIEKKKKKKRSFLKRLSGVKDVVVGEKEVEVDCIEIEPIFEQLGVKLQDSDFYR